MYEERQTKVSHLYREIKKVGQKVMGERGKEVKGKEMDVQTEQTEKKMRGGSEGG